MVAILLTRFQRHRRLDTGRGALSVRHASAVSFALAELLIGGFEDFEAWVVRGEFDQLLLRPLPITFQMITARVSDAALRPAGAGADRAGRVRSSCCKPRLESMSRCSSSRSCCIGGMLLFMAIFVVGATTSFWAPQAHEAVNIFSYGGQFMTSYPMHIYQEWLVSMFTFVIPMAFINYYPSLYLLDKPDPFGLPPSCRSCRRFVAGDRVPAGAVASGGRGCDDIRARAR